MTDAQHDSEHLTQDEAQAHALGYEIYFKQRLTALLDDPAMVEAIASGINRARVMRPMPNDLANAAIAAIKEAAGV